MKFEENEFCELKKSVSELKEAMKSISAILNKHNKGTIYFNVNPIGVPVFNKISDKTLRKISQSISDKIEPKIFPEISLVEVDSIEVIKVDFEGYQTPYSADGRDYMRVADEDKQMSQAQLKQLIIKGKNIRWDSISNFNLKIEDIDESKVRKFCSLIDIKFTSVISVLQNMNLIDGDVLLNSAILLFGKNPTNYFRNVRLSCALFGSNDTSLIIDQKEFDGDLFYLIETALNYILQNIHLGMKIENLIRKDIPEINKEALREAVINAFLHRDYFDPDMISIFIFRNRVEIRNPGKLFGGITIEDILTKNISRRRNEVLADILSRAHYGERKGHGIAFIRKAEPYVKFEQIGDIFITKFYRPSYRLSKEVVEELVEGLVESQRKIVFYIWENPKISKRELSEKLRISKTAVDKNIEKLKKINVLERIGADRGGRWQIKVQ